MKVNKIRISLHVEIDEVENDISYEILSLLNTTMARINRNVPGDKSMHTSMSTFQLEVDDEE